MPVPVGWDDIFTNPAENSPQGSEPLGTQADDYIRQAFAFCKQLHDGWVAADGSVLLTGDLDANSHTIKNLAAPVNTGDAVPKSYADNLFAANFPRGTIVMWYGQAGTQPAGWLICDGTNGTPDMRNRFPIGAGDQNPVGQVAGNSYPVISTAQLPAHNHAVVDNGHGHGVYDPTHNHGLQDNGHSHGIPVSGGGGGTGFSMPGSFNGNYVQDQRVGCGLAVNGNGTGVSIYGSGTGIWLQNTGGGQAFDNRPAFVGLFFLMKA